MGFFDGPKRKIKNYTDEKEKQKTAKDRIVLDNMINEIRGIPFGGLRGHLPDELISEYRRAAEDIMNIINNVDPTKEDTWEIDTQLKEIIGELKDAVQRKATAGIASCFQALKYAAITRKMDIPAKHEIKKYMDNRVDSLNSYRIIIANQKVIDERERDLLDQRDLKAHRLDEQEEAVKKVKDYRAANPIAAQKFKEHDYGPSTMELRDLMNKAIDLRNEIQNLEVQIGMNLDQITAATALIHEQEANLLNSNEDITQESLELAKEARERQLRQIDATRQAISEIRADTAKHASILNEMTKTTAEIKRYKDTNDAYEAIEKEINERPLKEQEAKTAMVKAETEAKRKEIEAREKLKAQEQEYEAAKQELDELNEENLKSMNEAFQTETEEVEEEIEEPILC